MTFSRQRDGRGNIIFVSLTLFQITPSFGEFINCPWHRRGRRLDTGQHPVPRELQAEPSHDEFWKKRWSTNVAGTALVADIGLLMSSGGYFAVIMVTNSASKEHWALAKIIQYRINVFKISLILLLYKHFE